MKKFCRKCKIAVEGELCPICKKDSFSSSFNGRIIFLDVNKSRIAEEMGVEVKGEYAIKIR